MIIEVLFLPFVKVAVLRFVGGVSFGHVNVGLWICVFPFGRFRNNEWSRLHTYGTEPPSVTIVTITVLVCLLRFIVVITLLVSAFALLLSSCVC